MFIKVKARRMVFLDGETTRLSVDLLSHKYLFWLLRLTNVSKRSYPFLKTEKKKGLKKKNKNILIFFRGGKIRKILKK